MYFRGAPAPLACTDTDSRLLAGPKRKGFVMADQTAAPAANGALTQRADAPANPVALAEAITASAVAAPQAPPIAVPIVDKQPMGSRQRGFVGGSLVSCTALLMTQLLAIWPAVSAAALNPPETRRTAILFGLVHMRIDAEVVLIAMVMLVGALGALVGGCRRFIYFSTRDELTRRDEWSYLMRPLQGAALALIVYFTLRGGYLGQDQSAPVNPYGVAALSALVGLFTRHAVNKLTDVFDTLFGQPKEDASPVHVRDG
jgi:hypothetical protein